MGVLSSVRLESWIAIMITLMACFTRLSMAAGQVFYVIAILLSIFYIWKHRHDLYVPSYVKKYSKTFALMLLLLLPSAVLTNNIAVGLPEFINVWLWRIPVFFVIALCIRDKKTLFTMLAVFFVDFGIDNLVAFYQHVSGMTDRGWGFGSSVLTISGLMVMLVPIFCVILLDSAFPSYVKASALWALGCVGFGMYGNQSRGSWLFNMIMVPIVSLPYILKRFGCVVAVLATLGGIVWGFSTQPQYVARFESITNTTTDGSNLGRFDVWTSSINMFKDHPVTGVGIGQWRTIYEASYRLPTENQHLYHAHNNFIQLLGEVGLLGLLGVLIFYGSIIVDNFVVWFKKRDPYSLCAMIAVICYVFVFGQIEYTLDNSSGMRIMYFMLATMLQLRNN
ncbi:MAG: O-antigen ligase family protein [Veillonella sp.]|uniref:O-antigen ligase family protein n=1 Tax=Veillonella TaxID=29465 RepID=UPI0029132F88|nr:MULTISPECIES: O-antigen ligase family protein [Veillonella]MDU3887407.1 O-antigen ligase family protein [Veillonella sp.]MDU4112345.1 O-antigen ligase family protein [Veillonella parvula]MDU4141613.1 O-antigen ligase family protein [Veillonella parvula]MDU6902993.1 O-antigen ligase family protein [Veillonella sp.]